MNNKTITFMACCVVATSISCQKAESERNIDESTIAASSQGELYTKEFQRIVVSSNMTVNATETAANELCNKIYNSLDKQNAILLFDQLGTMALAQSLVSNNYTKRQNHLLKLWYVTLNSFAFAQGCRHKSFDTWNNLFRFFKRYTDEISEVESILHSAKESGTARRADMGNYLHGIKGDLKQHVHVMRRFYFPKLSEGLTEEQKADILRRFEEVEKFAAFAPDSPCGRNERGKK